jgi:hypothetical protein
MGRGNPRYIVNSWMKVASIALDTLTLMKFRLSDNSVSHQTASAISRFSRFLYKLGLENLRNCNILEAVP